LSENNESAIQSVVSDKTGVPVLDEFSNPLFRLGYGSQAPLEATDYPLTRMTDNYALLNSLYRSGGICKSVVSIIPNDMTRKWYTLSGGIGPEHLRTLKQVERDTGLRESLDRGLQFGSLYGGVAGLIRIRGQEAVLDKPLDLSAILPGTFEGVQIFDRWCGITPDTELVFHRGQMAPKYYRIEDPESSFSTRVHHSRIIRFTGGILPYLEEMAELYWGESDIEPIYRDIVLYDNVMENMGNLTFRANIDTMEVQNLDQLFSLTSTEQQRRFWRVMQAQSVMQSNFGTRLVNAGDKVYNTQYSFTGFDHVTEAVQLNLCAKTHIPMTRLFGRSPAGMNATGESDLKNYYEYIDIRRETRLRPILEQLLPVLCMSAWGMVPDDLEIQFPPLWTPTAKEVAEIVEKKASAVRDMFQAGLIQADTAQKELKALSVETGMFGSITDEEIAANAGKTYQDVTALRDPLAGLGYGGEEAAPFEQNTGDGLTLDYKGQPREKNGRFSYGKLGGSSTKGKKSGKIKKPGLSQKEKARVSSGLLTDHPRLKSGEIKVYDYGTYQYRVFVKGPGEYHFISRTKLK